MKKGLNLKNLWLSSFIVNLESVRIQNRNLQVLQFELIKQKLICLFILNQIQQKVIRRKIKKRYLLKTLPKEPKTKKLSYKDWKTKSINSFILVTLKNRRNKHIDLIQIKTQIFYIKMIIWIIHFQSKSETVQKKNHPIYLCLADLDPRHIKLFQQKNQNKNIKFQ